MNFNLNKRNYFLIPMLLSLICVLIITLSNNFPLSWDIYTHINYSLAYLHNGITSVDYLLNAPNGKTIGYPPLFHMVLILTSFVSGTKLIDAARILQVLLSLCNVFTICYVAKEFYDEKVAFFAGILLLSSFMVTRLFLPIPETLAMIFFTLSVFFYYKASTESNYKFSILTAIFAMVTLITHFSSFIYLMLLLFVLMIVQTAILRKFDAIEYYIYVILPVFLLGIVSLVVLFVVSSSHLTQLLSGIISIINNPFDLFMGQVAMGLERYVRCVGIPLIFSIVGLYFSFKKKEFLFVSLWALIAFLITNLHWFGIPVYTFRLLLYLLVPMVILGGYAISNILDNVQNEKRDMATILTIALIILSFVLCIVHINDPSVNIYSSSTEQSTYQIAPPTSEEVEVLNWFEKEDVQNKSILINNLFFGTVISSVDEIPIHYGFDVYTNKSLTKSSYNSLNEEKIGYIVYDKSLILNDSDDYNYLDVQFVNGSYYPSYYFTKKITDDNFNNIKLQHTEKEFENDRFIICKVI